MIPADRALVQRYPELPGLEILLDPEALAGFVGAWGAGYGVERLRLKPGASVTAVMRPPCGRRPWLLVRGLAPHPWRTKRAKDIGAAQRAYEHLVEAGVPVEAVAAPAVIVDQSRRILITPAIGDRRLPGLRSLLPDTGVAVPLAAAAWREHLAPDVIDRLGDRSRLGTVHTLSHNPARRFVGHWAPLDGDGPGWLVRLHSDRPREIVEYIPGRPWAPSDVHPDIGALAAERERADAAAGRVWARHDLGAALEAAAAGVAALDVAGSEWSERSARLASELTTRLADRAVEPAHGDFSPDQLVVSPRGEVCVLDWDRAGLWPAGWDPATWSVTAQLAPLPHAAAHPSCLAGLMRPGAVSEESVPRAETTTGLREGGHDTIVEAAAALLRAPEPFRRRYPDWAEFTEALIERAENLAHDESTR